MSASQPATGALTSNAVFITLTVAEGEASLAAVRGFCGDLGSLVKAVGFRNPAAGLSCVMGIGDALWRRLGPGGAPRGLHPFREVAGVHHAPATPGDILFHIRASRPDLCFELATHVMDRLRAVTTVEDETQGFKFFDNRDLLGFVDGTENPEGAAALAAVTIGGEDPAYAGGSYVVVQKYLHDIDAWEALSVAEQERVIGRTKLDDLELPDAVKPSNSHVALNVVTDPDGTEREILRQNMPFGRLADGEFGTYFIGYAADPGVVEEMLRKMFLGEPPGNTDRILDFSTARTGALFFVPSIEFLDDPRPVARPGRTPAPVSPTPPPNSAGDGSLGIGSLKSTPAQRDSS